MKELCRVNDIKHLPGKTIRTKTDGEGHIGSVILAIGHIINEDWFCPKEDYKDIL